jgi:hypothetical protein
MVLSCPRVCVFVCACAGITACCEDKPTQACSTAGLGIVCDAGYELSSTIPCVDGFNCTSSVCCVPSPCMYAKPAFFVWP